MIDLSVAIRNRLLTIPDFYSIISNYHDSKAVFAFRPVPQDAAYPMSVISSIGGSFDNDMLACSRRTFSYHVFIYDKNLNPDNYIDIERAANSVARSFHRMDATSLDVQGVRIISVTASTPFPAPTDNNETIARAITLNFEVTY